MTAGNADSPFGDAADAKRLIDGYESTVAQDEDAIGDATHPRELVGSDDDRTSATAPSVR